MKYLFTNDELRRELRQEFSRMIEREVEGGLARFKEMTKRIERLEEKFSSLLSGQPAPAFDMRQRQDGGNPWRKLTLVVEVGDLKRALISTIPSDDGKITAHCLWPECCYREIQSMDFVWKGTPHDKKCPLHGIT